MTSRTDLSPAFRPPGLERQTPSIPSVPAPATPQLPDLPVDQLITKALSGTLSGPEAAALSQLLDSPQANDKFTPEQRADLQKFQQGRELPPRAPDELHSDLKLLKEAREVPDRFTADFVLARESLLEHASLLRADKATRMFDFMVPYVKAVVQMAATPAQQAFVAAQLVKQAEKAGFKALEQQPDGQNALRVLQELLKVKTPGDVDRLAHGLKFDAPIWPKDPIRQSDPRHPAERENLQPVQAAAQKAGEPQLMRPMPPVMQPPVPIQQRVVDPEPSRESHDGTRKRLGPMMLWNVLHRLRDAGEDDQESAAQREAMTQLAVAAALILGLMAIIVGVLVAI